MKLAVTIAAFVVLAGSASAGTTPTQTHSTILGATVLYRTPLTLKTSKSLPYSVSSARIQSGMNFNGHVPQSCWFDSSTQWECGWKGVLVVVSGQKRNAPATVQIISLRRQPTKVWLRLAW